MSLPSRILAYSCIGSVEVFILLTTVFFPVKAPSFLVSHPSSLFLTLALTVVWSIVLGWAVVVVVLFWERSLLLSRIWVGIPRLRTRNNGGSWARTELWTFCRFLMNTSLFLSLSFSLLLLLPFSLSLSLSFLLFLHFLKSFLFFS